MHLELVPCKSMLKSPAICVCFDAISRILLNSSKAFSKLPFGGRYSVPIVVGLSPLIVTNKVSRFSVTCESLSSIVAFMISHIFFKI